MKRIVIIIVILFLPAYFAQAQLKYLQDVKELPPHPRILMLEGEEQAIKNNIAADPVWGKIHQSILDECEDFILQPTLTRIQTGRRILGVSGQAIRRIFYLSYAYRMEGGKKYLRHAEKELLAISSFTDWNPSHFLDAAEMTMAAAIGYDWLYHSLSASSREIIRAAILTKGIDPSLAHGFRGWTSNWNQVCNAGITYGALAVFEDMPEFSKMIIDKAVETIQLPMHEYAPDGAYPEGYGYWGYGTTFNVMFLSAIEKALGKDYGLSQLPGFLKTAQYLQHMTGTSELCFNYADNNGAGSLSPAMFWLSLKAGDPSLLWNEKTYMESDRKFTRDRLLPALMIWGSSVRMAGIQPPEKVMFAGRGVTPVALMRTSWTDPDALYVGFKGGIASSSHAHMDAGSFIMESDGVRWAMDFGSQNYHSLESRGVDLWNMSQNSQRWEVFRYNNYVHNTLTVDQQLHNVKGHADIISHSSSPAFMNAVVDLSEVFDGQLQSSRRGVAVVDRQYVIIRDELRTLDKETVVRWTMLTSADVKIKGQNKIQLEKEGKKLTLEVTEPAKVNMKTWPTTPVNKYDAPNPGTTLVGFEVKVPANTEAVLLVKLIPQSTKRTTAKVSELSQWPK